MQGGAGTLIQGACLINKQFVMEKNDDFDIFSLFFFYHLGKTLTFSTQTSYSRRTVYHPVTYFPGGSLIREAHLFGSLE